MLNLYQDLRELFCTRVTLEQLRALFPEQIVLINELFMKHEDRPTGLIIKRSETPFYCAIRVFKSFEIESEVY